MKLSEFKIQERGPRLFDRWLWEETLETPLGRFEVELHTDDNEIPPDEEMVRYAAELVHFAEANAGHIADIVFGYYRLAEESDPHWLDCCDVPRGLAKTEISKFLNGLWLIVTRGLGLEKPYYSAIFINPL